MCDCSCMCVCGSVCGAQVSTYHLMDGAVEGVVLGEDEEDDEGHVHVVGVSFLHMVEDL